ncbi:ATP-binding cassette transporter [Dorcoceras hygrometricum]|uniref:ATP-binding cassette transporter n=1 Tax=Dorcoceras hygrometricum TaxID=472368 RepID=A0A2Z6ZTW9_9LAMI|nr:ATP-binding cassette transporter [Dorcoceras hygrometricum]
MTSSVTSSYSADGLSEQSQESADSAGRVCVVIQSQSIVVEEDSGEAIDEPDASNSSIQSRAYMNQLLLLNQSQALHIQSTWFPGAKNRRSSKAQQLKNESAAKQLTTYEKLSKMDVNC